MGREVRMVPANWEHPKNGEGHYIPLCDGFIADLGDWEEGNRQWERGLIRDWSNGGWQPKGNSDKCSTFEEWAGAKPESKEYMPDWPQSERTHYQMYEDCTEGTPISPVMETPEALARWLADNKASAFADQTATYEQWLAMIGEGHAPSAVHSTRTGLISGVEAVAEKREPK